MQPPNPEIGILLLGLTVASVLLSLFDSHQGSPLVGIINRWVRWFLIALGSSYLIVYFGLSTRPLWALCAMAFLLWFLFETAYNWLVISAVSRSDIPLFPRFRQNTEGDEWPAEARFLKIREWLRKNNFRKRQSLKADLMEGVELRSSVYDSGDGQIRLQLLFVPLKNGNLSACFIFSSALETDRRLITDNVFMPFGGFYPEQWELVRRPLARSLSGLCRLHRRRLEREPDVVEPWESPLEPLEDLNEQQRILEKINTDMGFLLPRYLQEEHGKITPTGRFRIWMELWLLNYFGKTVSTKS